MSQRSIFDSRVPVLVLIRAWAIWGCKQSVGVILIVVYVSYIVAAIVMIAHMGKDVYCEWYGPRFH